jgi:hypothetical protein
MPKTSFRAPVAALHNPSASSVPESFHVAQQVLKAIGAAVHARDMEMFSVVSGSIDRQVLCGVSCDACKTCLTSDFFHHPEF